MKLETKHLAPYLPYGLKFTFTKDYYYPYPSMQKKGFYFTFDLLESPKIIYCSNINKSWIDVVLNQDYFKPILRPLSDISKEIEVNGEKFIPIFELAKISNFKHDFKRIVNENGTIVLYSDVSKHPELDHPGLVHFFEMDTEDCDFDYGFESLGQDGEVCDTFFFPIKNQLSLFNKLFEWHFDVFGLLEKGLAIDINTL